MVFHPFAGFNVGRSIVSLPFKESALFSVGDLCLGAAALYINAMDSFTKCRVASESVAWSFDEALSDLSFDFSKNFLPRMLCGQQQPEWLSLDDRRTLNHLRAFSYAHIFEFVEEFIVLQTCQTAMNYVNDDTEAVSAVLNFASEETKHQRMFALVKERLVEGLGFQPAVIPDQGDVARAICEKPAFSVYMLILTLEWLTQRHFIESFGEEEPKLDSGYVSIFRLHWIEEAQHARIDQLELEALAKTMTHKDVTEAIHAYIGLLYDLRLKIMEQNKLDIQSFEQLRGQKLEADERVQLLHALNKEYLWTFIISGLEHKAFQSAYNKVVPAGIYSILQLSGELGASLEPAPEHSLVYGANQQRAAGVGTAKDASGQPLRSALVVDDQEYVRSFACYVLEDMGFDILGAATGEQAMSIFEEHHENLAVVLLDVTLPDVSGRQLLDQMHALNGDVPIILSSGHMRADVLDSYSGEMLSGYLQKPYMPADLETAVRDAISAGATSD